MSMQDPIADMLTRIRNAQAMQKAQVSMPDSKMKRAVAQVLVDEGYTKSFKSGDAEGKPTLTIDLKYHHGQGVIAKLERVSKPSMRVYRACDDFPKILGGLGTVIVSTSKGVMSDRAARKLGIGGEVICVVE